MPSSVGFETLIAKLLEVHGCFVPAYRGGCIQDVDLFAHNDGPHNLQMGGLTIAAGKSAAIQVKTWSGGMWKPVSVDCLVGLGLVRAKAVGQERVLNQVRKCPSVSRWLERSLYRLPSSLLAKYGLA
jgi:hypothetical protein